MLDSESQDPLDVQMYQLKETHALVEEFMLLANITVSPFCPWPHRSVHPPVAVVVPTLHSFQSLLPLHRVGTISPAHCSLLHF